MKFLRRVTLIVVCISAFYLAVSAMLSFTEITFRAWVKTLGQMIVWIVTPGMILFLALVYLYGNERVHKAVRIVCTTAAVIAGGAYAFFVFFFILLGVQEERMLTRHLLVTDESFLSEIDPVYYRPTALFFKKPGEITAADRLEYLEKKYKRPFEISRSGNTFYDVALPDVQVAVAPDGMSLTDNYVEKVTLHSLLEVYHTVEMKREYHIVHNGKAGTNNREYLCLEASGYDDITALSDDLVCLAAGALSGAFCTSEFDVMDFFHEYRGKVCFSFGDDAKGYTGSISFGGKDGEWPIDVEAMVRIAYSKHGNDEQEEVQEPYSNIREGEADEKVSDQETEIEYDSEESDYREEAARIVYDAALAEEGFSYEVCYNAKGNLYIDLGTKVSDEDGGKVYSYRLVYDRPSKNGACELLVLYRSLEGSDSEAIVDMYAVETATGKVVVSGRKAWSDVGTKEYREMTGE